MQRNKTKLFLMAVLSFTLLLTIAAYGFFALKKDGIDFGNVIGFVVPLLVVIFMAFFLVRRYRDVKQGQPMEDERSRKVMNAAAAKSFYISLYWLLAISWFESLFAEKLFGSAHLDASQTVGGGIAGMAIIFFLAWFYYQKKGTSF
jgi:hypothetical protein